MALKNVIDTDAVAAGLGNWCSARVINEPDVRVTNLLVPASAGLSNETVLFDLSWTQDGAIRTRPLVARVQPTGPGVFPRYDLAKEARVLSALGEHTGVPVPETYAYESDPTVFGAPFLVMARVDGRVPSDDPPFTAGGWVLDLTPEQREVMWHNSIDTVADIHATDWNALGLDFLDTAENGSGLDAQIADCRATFAWAAEGEANPTIEYALNWLAANKPAENGPTVLNWGDARVGNLIFDDNLAVAAVLDWEMVTLGSRELDLGWWLFLMRHHTEGIGLPLPEGIPGPQETIERYRARTGYTPTNLHYYEVLAATKLSWLMVRAAHLMIAAGLLPPDSPMALNNPASQLLAKLLDQPAPTGRTTSFIGNR